MQVPTLKHFSRLTLIQCLVNTDSPSLWLGSKCLALLKQLDHGSWGEESNELLRRLVKYYKHKVTSKLVDALLPSNAKTLCLKSCNQITGDCLNKILHRCTHLVSLDLSALPDLNFHLVGLFSLDNGCKYGTLTVVDLDGCTQVTDAVVQNLLRNATSLQSLNIAQTNITDKVFLMDEVKQLAREALIEIPGLTETYDCILQTLDISGCQNVSSTCIRHLCTLCGPTLHTLNIAWTKIECTAFLYLSGLGLPAAVRYYNEFTDKKAPKTSTLAQTLKEFDDLSRKVKRLFNWKHDIRSGTDLLCSNALKRINGSIQKQGKSHSENIVPCSLSDGSENYCQKGQQDLLLMERRTGNDTHSTESLAASLQCSNPSKVLDAHFDNKETIHSQVFSDFSEPLTLSSDPINLNTGTAEQESTFNAVGMPPNNALGDSGPIMAFYKPAITSFCCCGYAFDEDLCLLYFEQFLCSNTSLTSLRVYGGKTSPIVSDRILQKIGTFCPELTQISLEGCDRITDVGIMQLMQLNNLTEIDFTGVPFIDDNVIAPLVEFYQLSRFRVAETMITNNSLLMIALGRFPLKLTDLDLSWCEDIESDDGLNAIASNCRNLQKLTLRESCVTTLTLNLLAQNCSMITVLNISSNMNAVNDSALIMLSENLTLLEKINLDWNSQLTDGAIHALLTNCTRLTYVNLEGVKEITSAPFIKIISIPEELASFLQEYIKKNQFAFADGTFSPNLAKFPCLPHRSTTFCTELMYLNLTYCDFVEDDVLQNIAAVTQGSLTIIEYYGQEVKGTMENFINNTFTDSIVGS
ncbi:F-box/LRR-repeat protein 2 [Biomphalaria glabrata]|nr:F-box/LRR-repeat protein 2 [Biomphalaria glabrata]